MTLFLCNFYISKLYHILESNHSTFYVWSFQVSFPYKFLVLKMRTLLLTKYMWKTITFHCLPSLRYQVSLEHLYVFLDAICTKYIVLQRRLKIYEYKSQVVTYYWCHSGGNKVRPHRKTWSVKPSDGKGSRKERRSRLCDYAFQVNTMQPKVHEKASEALKNRREVTIFVHSKHIGHEHGFDAVSFFLPVHLEVISWATKNLKYMFCVRSVVRASERDE